MENQNPEQQAPTKHFILMELEGDKIRCQIEGDHNRIVQMVSSLMIDKEGPIREIIDHTLSVVMKHEMREEGLTMSDLLQTIVNQTPKGEA